MTVTRGKLVEAALADALDLLLGEGNLDISHTALILGSFAADKIAKARAALAAYRAKAEPSAHGDAELATDDDLDAIVKAQWLKVKPSHEAQKARSAAYPLEWSDLDFPPYVVGIMDIAAQKAIDDLAQRIAKARADAIRECADVARGAYKRSFRSGDEAALDPDNIAADILVLLEPPHD